MAEMKETKRIILKKNWLGEFAGKRLTMTAKRAEQLVKDGIAEYDPFPSEPVIASGPQLPRMSTEEAFGKKARK
jgi:hypothetical protein